MAEQVLVQVRVDKKLKEEVSEIYEMPKETITRPEALDALDALFQQASGAPDMTQDEINAEIAAVRAARKAVKQ